MQSVLRKPLLMALVAFNFFVGKCYIAVVFTALEQLLPADGMLGRTWLAAEGRVHPLRRVPKAKRPGRAGLGQGAGAEQLGKGAGGGGGSARGS